MSGWTPGLYHLVGVSELFGWHGEVECLSGLEVDDKLELVRSSDRQFARVCASENSDELVRLNGSTGTVNDS
jgi:hypothetical protein